MRKLLRILRRASADETPYWQTFEYETDEVDATVATALASLNEREDLADVEGHPASPIRFESSCLQRKCGACAMLINGRPGLACDTRLFALRGGVATLEPLRKFSVVADLVVDRSEMRENLRRAGVWLEGEARLRPKRLDVAYQASRCLQCGCCLEVCPNYARGEAFGGMAVMVPLARLIAEADDVERARLARRYREVVWGGCGKSLACRMVCPAEIDIEGLMSRANATAVWRRW